MLIKTNQIKHLKKGSLHRQEETIQAGSKEQVDKQIGCRSPAARAREFTVIGNICTSLWKLHAWATVLQSLKAPHGEEFPSDSDDRPEWKSRAPRCKIGDLKAMSTCQVTDNI